MGEIQLYCERINSCAIQMKGIFSIKSSKSFPKVLKTDLIIVLKKNSAKWKCQMSLWQRKPVLDVYTYFKSRIEFSVSRTLEEREREFSERSIPNAAHV